MPTNNVELTPQEATMLLEAISAKPITLTIGSAIKGITIGEDLVQLITKLQLIAKPMMTDESVKYGAADGTEQEDAPVVEEEPKA